MDKKLIIKVLGTGCAKCNRLVENVKRTVDSLNIDYKIIKVTDIMEIAATGVMKTPGLIVNGKIVSSGKVPSIDELKEILKDN